ncbi:valine--tRNA ligase [bacterium]|nr:valine--tRNA ligase [bacterium]
MIELDKLYDPKKTEDKWYSFWNENKLFRAEVDSKKKPYTVVIPPPNVTGVLHMGHALNNTLQDILIRWKKMEGYNALWIPGTDHAGIATQNVVERKLGKENRTKDDLGREKFIEEVWNWKEKHGGVIISQLKKLGCACDWSRERFTMDEGLSHAVKQAFITLYDKGLIYRGNYIINWCPRCKTALSDEEASHQEKQGKIYYIKYPIKGSSEYIVVATTRPETMFGDVAVAVNPKDKRLKKLEGKTLILPILNRELKIIQDEFVDPAFGTGFVKVTPAHDPNDFEMGLRHNLEPINIMNDNATMTGTGKYDGMDRFECRRAVISDLKELGLLEKIEDHANAVGHCYRCDTMVEPRLSKQWFVKMKPLAEKAIEVVKNKEVCFHPDRWEKIYLNWMENIRDWCISRQIWWGHRIPVWYCKSCNEVVVSMGVPEECPECKSHSLVQEEDVLDTWFSSWLWPISTLGWPDDDKDLNYFYPTAALCTAQEIIFFWVARMIMAGLEFKGKIPFKDVYIHGTVRDDTGKKMSKSLGNTIDPVEVINEFSADALRFSIIMITAKGQDVFLSKDKFEIGRNFSNKIWNAARFLLRNAPAELEVSLKKADLSLADKWILSRLNKNIEKINDALESYRFNEAAHALYDFIWHDYCDWYIEVVKPNLENEKTLGVLVYVLDQALKMLHPFMPFITEELWQRLPLKRDVKSIMQTQWPVVNKKMIDDEIENEFVMIQTLVQLIRNSRREFNIPPGKELKVLVKCKDEEVQNTLKNDSDIIKFLAKLESIEIDIDIKKPASSTVAVSEKFEAYVLLEGVIDIEEEKKRIQKNINKVCEDIAKVRNKLSNKDFVEKANPEVVEKEKEKQAGFVEMKEKLDAQLASLE